MAARPSQPSPSQPHSQWAPAVPRRSPAAPRFPDQVWVTALCSQGGVTLLGMGNGDYVTGNIELIYSTAGRWRVWVPGVGSTWTGGPKTPYRFTATGNTSFMACVDAPGERMQVTYTVSRAPFWQSIRVANTGTYATVQ